MGLPLQNASRGTIKYPGQERWAPLGAGDAMPESPEGPICFFHAQLGEKLGAASQPWDADGKAREADFQHDALLPLLPPVI